MSYSFPGDGRRDFSAGELRGGPRVQTEQGRPRTMPTGRSLPWHLRPARGQCVVEHGVLECICGECPPYIPEPIPLEQYPEHIPGWTVQQGG